MTPNEIDYLQMQASAERASQFLKSLSHQGRLLLLCQLSQGELGVSELEKLTDIQQPSLSQHLGVLRRDGLIAPRKVGKSVFYRISDPNVLTMLQQLYVMFCNSGENQ
ncbi:ArsR/SmtB family transcription factor [Marinobacter caseinilyticus]|uniref:ArsR/SmtB family transcription factor n=1 Tax=Marinobacter caseinilyticus TaxID=2692195 RepID=UPI0014072C5E|nr:metalloregulator ArsR/SmtB family transcription factor [Marinobacter caseinilyticus]